MSNRNRIDEILGALLLAAAVIATLCAAWLIGPPAW